MVMLHRFAPGSLGGLGDRWCGRLDLQHDGLVTAPAVVRAQLLTGSHALRCLPSSGTMAANPVPSGARLRGAVRSSVALSCSAELVAPGRVWPARTVEKPCQAVAAGERPARTRRPSENAWSSTPARACPRAVRFGPLAPQLWQWQEDGSPKSGSNFRRAAGTAFLIGGAAALRGTGLRRLLAP
jgi:hypothetical protein